MFSLVFLYSPYQSQERARVKERGRSKSSGFSLLSSKTPTDGKEEKRKEEAAAAEADRGGDALSFLPSSFSCCLNIQSAPPPLSSFCLSQAVSAEEATEEEVDDEGEWRNSKDRTKREKKVCLSSFSFLPPQCVSSFKWLVSREGGRRGKLLHPFYQPQCQFVRTGDEVRRSSAK